MRVLLASMLVAASLFSPSTASAITSRQGGIYLTPAGGFALGGVPFGPAIASQLSIGWWFGNYDDVFALGRHHGIGVTARIDVDTRDWTPRSAAMLEYRRGYDLIVAGGHVFVAAGPELTAGGVGATVRAGLAVKYRPHRYIGPTLRIEGGAGYGPDGVAAQVGVLLGFELAAPVVRNPR